MGDKMNKIFVVAAALGLSACASMPKMPDLPDLPNLPAVHGLNDTYGERTDWSCASGSHFSIRINEDTHRAEVFAGGRRYHLDQTEAGFGAGEVSYFERGGMASLSGAHGGPYDLCRKV